ncbi:ABC transporter permease [Gluconobacter cerinus]|uniref:ABC transporter permease n=1 Tax=Gluconobacter cerinus TaxID=38307 RepID=UPI001C04EB0E|nr:ABC transporter permease [Gluconobacter cerinus]
MGTTLLRSLLRHRLSTALNIAGLGLGISVFLTMALIVRYEYGYDSAVPHSGHLYQLVIDPHPPGRAREEFEQISFVPFPFLREDFPGIQAAIRLENGSKPVRVGDVLAQEPVVMADASFFSVFDLPLAAGTKRGALDGTGKAVIAGRIARKYFGTSDAVGRQILIGGVPTTITAVLADEAANTTLRFGVIIPFPSDAMNAPLFRHWRASNGRIWLRIDHPDAAKLINTAMVGYPYRYPDGDMTSGEMHDWFGDGGLKLIPLRGVHFRGASTGQFGASSRLLVDALGLIGLAALATAIINYVNLATAQSGLRTREVALRKVMGATRIRLIIQFLGEAIVLVAVAGLFGAVLTEVALAWVDALGGWTVSLDWGFVVPTLLAVIAGVGVLAGAYPTLVLSAYRPAAVLAASKMPAGGRHGATVRSTLVVVQFALAITLTICTLVIGSQVRFERALDRGLRQDGLIVVNALHDKSLIGRQASLVRKLASVPGVQRIAIADIFPHHLYSNRGWRREGSGPEVDTFWGSVGTGYFPSLGARLLAGRWLDEAHGTDFHADPLTAGHGVSVMLSRQAARQLGFASPASAIGQVVTYAGGSRFRVIGVVEDMRFGDNRDPALPLLFLGATGGMSEGAALIRFSGVSNQEELARLQAAWRQLAPGVPFSGRSMADIVADEYRVDAKHSTLFGIGSAVAIGIACLGLYGLSAFNVARRRHEIGIRKVLGARTGNVLVLLIGQFLRPVLLANALAWPTAFLLMRNWLAGFDQRIRLGVGQFVLVSVGAALIAGAVVFAQTLHAARQAPAAALRQE